jgi:hypothetical protein
MYYLTIDGELSGTGIRDSVIGGYINADELGLPEQLRMRIATWVQRYESAHFEQFQNTEENKQLDAEGLAIAKLVQANLSESKVEYYSNAYMKKMFFVAD